MDNLGKIISIDEVFDLKFQFRTQTGKRMGMVQTLNAILGATGNMEGYKIKTDRHEFYVLIDSVQCCCESWGYFISEDDCNKFIGAELFEVNLTDKCLNSKKFEESGYYEEEGGIQFVDFVTNKGKFQLAVYNAHNGYYGHPILILKDEEILLDDVL